MGDPKIVNTSYIFISSESVGGLANDFSVNIPEDSIKAAANQFIRLTLSQHSIINQLPNVASNHNTFYITPNGQYQIPNGAYRIVDLVQVFTQLQPTVKIEYIERQNVFRFTNTTNTSRTLSFQGYLGKLFGFARGQTLTIPAFGAGESTRPLIPQLVTDLLLHLTNILTDTPTNLSNLASPDLTASSIVAVIPLRAPPRALNSFYNWNSAYTLDVFDLDPQRIGFRTTDQNGVLIENLPNWTAVIRVDIMQRPDTDGSLIKLEQMVEYLRLIFLSSNLKDREEEEQPEASSQVVVESMR